jgi:hypothetical protein
VTEGGRRDGTRTVAGHGFITKYDGWTQVPPRTYLHFYVKHGEMLADGVGNAIERGARNVMPAETFGPGSWVQNYLIGPPGGLNIMSGSIRVSEVRSLSELFTSEMSGGGIFHMAVCREVLPY